MIIVILKQIHILRRETLDLIIGRGESWEDTHVWFDQFIIAPFEQRQVGLLLNLFI